MTVSRAQALHYGFWFAFCLAVGVFLYLFQGILFPFAFSFVLAYALSPFVEKCQRYCHSRTIISLGVLMAFVAGGFMVFSLLVPSLEDEVTRLAEKAPAYLSRLCMLSVPFFERFLGAFPEHFPPHFREEILSSLGKSVGALSTLLGSLVSGGRALASFISTFFLIPLLLFYFLRDWPRIIKSVEAVVPLHAMPVFGELRSRVRLSFERYLKGQGLIALALSVYYSCGLLFLGVEPAILLGVLTGFFSFIPFIGALVFFFFSLLICVMQYASFVEVCALAGLFLFAQFLETHVLYPRFVGKEAGLHPVWLLFALFAGFHLQGGAGIAFAVPVASILNAIVLYSRERFRLSSFYNGRI